MRRAFNMLKWKNFGRKKKNIQRCTVESLFMSVLTLLEEFKRNEKGEGGIFFMAAL